MMHKGFRWTISCHSLFLGIFLSILLLSATSFADPVRFSPEKTVVVGVNKDFAPVEFQNSKGHPDGYTVDLIKAIAKIEGLNIKFKLDTWSNLRRDLQDQEIDMVAGMLYSKERDKMFDFSLSTAMISYAIFIRKGAPITSLDNLKEKEIIIVEDVYAHDWLLENRSTSSIISVKTPTEAMQLLASGQHDCVIMPRLPGLDLLDELKINNIETTGPPVLVQELCFAVADGNSDLLAELNEGIFALQQSGEYDEIYQKWVSVEKYTKQIRRIKKYGFLGFSLLTLLLLIVLFCNWWLKRTVRLKTKEIGQNQERLQQIVQGIPIPAYVVDENRTVTHWNKACEFLTGKAADTIVGSKDYARAFHDKKTYSIVDLLFDNILTKRVQRYDNTTYRESSLLAGAYEAEMYFPGLGIDGKWLYGAAALLKEENGKIHGAVETWQDLTEPKQLERQLIQSQKMEAIGTLASGVAHDFNNILLGLMGHAELALMDVPKESPLKDDLQQILAAAMRAKEIVNQILTFTRQADIQSEPIQVSTVVREALKLFTSSLPPDITVHVDIQSDAWTMADATHLHQVTMNLCTNARHAMSDTGGVLGVRLYEVQFDEDQLRLQLAGLTPGRFIKLSISDTGCGIPHEIREKILDPFFTTKKRGEGTGMGLSVTLGIVKQYGGMLTFTSDPGKGSTFEVYLPIYQPV
jgi:two-component system sensor histidine kinase EvgS